MLEAFPHLEPFIHTIGVGDRERGDWQGLDWPEETLVQEKALRVADAVKDLRVAAKFAWAIKHHGNRSPYVQEPINKLKAALWNHMQPQLAPTSEPKSTFAPELVSQPELETGRYVGILDGVVRIDAVSTDAQVGEDVDSKPANELAEVGAFVIGETVTVAAEGPDKDDLEPLEEDLDVLIDGIGDGDDEVMSRPNGGRPRVTREDSRVPKADITITELIAIVRSWDGEKPLTRDVITTIRRIPVGRFDLSQAERKLLDEVAPPLARGKAVPVKPHTMDMLLGKRRYEQLEWYELRDHIAGIVEGLVQKAINLNQVKRIR